MRGENMSDKVKMQGIMEQGYGISPKLVMRDKDLSIEAKAIYAYMSSFAGNGSSAYPSISLACRDLNVSEKRYRKHRDMLVDKGYITIEQQKNEGKFNNNVYIINQIIEPPYGQNVMTAKRRDGDLSTRQNDRTNNNSSFNNNNISNNNSNKDSHVRDIFNHYLSKNIVQHQKITSAMRTAVNARLRDYSYEQLVQAIDNYSTVYHSDQYWFDTKYTLADLMRDKDVRKFIDDADPLNNFKRGDNNGVYGRGNGYAGNTPKGTSYEQAIAEAERARKSFGRG